MDSMWIIQKKEIDPDDPTPLIDQGLHAKRGTGCSPSGTGQN